jgi:putative transcriptional regulator
MKMLITRKDYGTVQLHLKELMDEKGIVRGTLARAIGSRFEVVDRWYRGEVAELDLDILARICCILDCQISDLITYQKPSEDIK